MVRGLVPRVREERVAAPLPGFKLACPLVSGDGRRAGFSGVTIGRTTIYGAVATAECAQGGHHRSPRWWCDCGFYCLHTLADARALACDPDYRHAVVLEVAASGRFLRYERGLRYARQRVTAVRVGRCGCGRPATAFAETGAGVPGWRRLAGTCAECAPGRPWLSLAAFGRLLGGTPVRMDDTAGPGAGPGADPAARLGAAPAGGPAGGARLGVAPAGGAALGEVDKEALVPLLTAEVALLQARLDEVQRQLARLTED